MTLLSADTPVATSTEPLPVITEITLAPSTQTFTPTEPGQASDESPRLPANHHARLLDQPDYAGYADAAADGYARSEQRHQHGQPPRTLSGSSNNSGTPEETLVSGADCTYTVEAGDSLYRIAVLNDVTVDDMKAANPDLVGDAPILQPGQVLKIPFCVPGEGTMTPLPSSEAGSGPTETPAPAASQEIYTVQPGDTLGAIATRFGVTVNAIMRANDLDNPNRLSIGQTLIIPAKAS